jgi:hypothetical protein
LAKKDADRLARDLRHYFTEAKLPYRVILRGGHWHVVTEKGASLGSFGATPSDNHFRGNAIAQLRRRGVIPKEWR